MKPIDVIDDSYVEYNETSNKKDPKFKVGSMLEFQSIKIFLLKDMLQIGLKNFLLLVKLKIQFLGHVWLMIWMVKKLLEVFMKKNCKRLVKKNLE